MDIKGKKGEDKDCPFVSGLDNQPIILFLKLYSGVSGKLINFKWHTSENINIILMAEQSLLKENYAFLDSYFMSNMLF